MLDRSRKMTRIEQLKAKAKYSGQFTDRVDYFSYGDDLINVCIGKQMRGDEKTATLV